MKAVLQRVLQAEVLVEGKSIGKIERGLLVFLGVEAGDSEREIERICSKILSLRIFADSAGKMNLNLQQTGGSLLLVSQFTLCADLWSGNRPSFTGAEKPERAKILYEAATAWFQAQDIPIATGSFGADMKVSLVNDGPATFLIDSPSGSA